METTSAATADGVSTSLHLDESQPSSVLPLASGVTLTLPHPLEGFEVIETKTRYDYALKIDHSYVRFFNSKSGASYVFSTVRGDAVREALADPSGHGYSLLNGVTVGGKQVYIMRIGDSSTDVNSSVEIAWATTEEEVVSVVGQGVPLDQVIALAHLLKEVAK